MNCLCHALNLGMKYCLIIDREDLTEPKSFVHFCTIVNEILMFEDSRIRMSARSTISECIAHRAWCASRGKRGWSGRRAS